MSVKNLYTQFFTLYDIKRAKMLQGEMLIKIKNYLFNSSSILF